MKMNFSADFAHYQKRLDFYLKLKEKLGSKSEVADKWIEVYQGRIQSMEKSGIDSGLKILLDSEVENNETTLEVSRKHA